MSDTNSQTVKRLEQPNATENIAEVHGRALEVEEVADIIWLAAQIWRSSPVIHSPTVQKPSPSATTGPKETKNTSKNDLDKLNSVQEKKPEVNKPVMEGSQQIASSKEHPASMHLPHNLHSDDGDRGIPFFTPTAPALPRKLDLARSLRPLKLTTLSPTLDEIDDVLSAEKSAETNTPIIVLRPQKRRWLDIVLVIDESPTMAIWHRTVDEFVTMLEQMGAFRNITTYGLALEQADDKTLPPTLRLHRTTGAGRLDGRTCDPVELIDPRGERVILTVTDTSSEAWYWGQVPQLLNLWSKYGPVTILHMLPRNMWENTILVNELDVKLNSNTPCVPNGKLRVVEWPWYWDADDINEDEGDQIENLADPIPVITLEPYSLGPWANLIAGRVQSRTFGYIFLPEITGAESEDKETTKVFTTQAGWHNLTKPQITLIGEQADIFFKRQWQTLSRPARELASYLASVPINLEIIRIVQQQIMGQEAQQTHVAELMYSGLFCQLAPPNSLQPPDEIIYDFYGGAEVRRCWRETALRTRAVDVFHKITDYIDANAGRGTGFKALLYNQKLDADMQLNALEMAFAEIAPEALRDLGDFYAELAKQLETTIWTNIEADGSYRTTSTTITPKEGIQHHQRVIEEKKPLFDGFALIIGVNANLVESLNIGGIANATQFLHEILTDPEICGYDPKRVHILEGPEATRNNILKEIGWLCKRLSINREATGLIIYKGHGYRLDEDEFYLLPYDTVKDDIAQTAVSATDVAQLIADTPFYRLAVALDCSYAGGFGERIHSELAKLTDSPRYAILCSASATQKSWMRPDNLMGIFTYHLIAALYGMVRQHDSTSIDSDQIWSYIANQIAEEQKSGERKQTPVAYQNSNFPITLAGAKSLSINKPVSLLHGLKAVEKSVEVTIVATSSRETTVSWDIRNTGYAQWEPGCYLQSNSDASSEHSDLIPYLSALADIELPLLKPGQSTQISYSIIPPISIGILNLRWDAKTATGKQFALSDGLGLCLKVCIGGVVSKDYAHIIKLPKGEFHISTDDYSFNTRDISEDTIDNTIIDNYLSNDLLVHGSAIINSPTFISRDVDIKGNLQINAPTIVGRDVDIKGNLQINALIYVERDIDVRGSLFGATAILVERDVDVSGTLYYTSLYIGGSFYGGYLKLYRIYTPVDSILSREILNQLPTNEIPAIDALPPMSRMPSSPLSEFSGRSKELTQLAKRFSEEDSTSEPKPSEKIHAVILAGLGGIGKTTLAAGFAYRYGRYFLGGVFWLNFSNSDAIPFEIILCGGQEGLAIPGFELLKFDEQLKLVQEEWSSDVPRLLIADDCSDADLIREWLPQTGGCHIIITTRNQALAQELDIPQLTTSNLTLEDSEKLLLMHAPHLTSSDAQIIAKTVDGHSHSLVLAGKYLNTVQHRVSASEYVGKLQTFLNEDSSSAQREQAHQLAVLKISWELLNSSEAEYRFAKAILIQASQFSPDTIIPLEFLEKSIALRVKSTLTSATDNDLLKHWTETQGTEVLRLLQQLGLIELRDEEIRSLSVHPYIAAFVLDQEESLSAQYALEDMIQNEIQDKQLLDGARFTQIRSWREHFQHAADRTIGRVDQRANNLCAAYTEYLMLEGVYASAIPYAQRELEIKRSIGGLPEIEIAGATERLGRLHYRLGHLEEAERYFEETYQINRSVLGETHRHTAQALNNLAAVYNERGQYTKALALHQKTLQIRQKVLGDIHPDTAESLNNLAETYRALGDFAKALPYYQQALEIRREVLGEGHPDTASSLNNMGSLLQAMGDNEGARPYYERALTIRQEVLGERHPDTASSLNNMGSLLQVMGEWAMAQSYYERTLSVSREIGDLSSEANNLANLGVLHQEQGHIELARANWQKALIIFEQIQSPQASRLREWLADSFQHDNLQKDIVSGDKVGGDMVSGDKILVGNISSSRGVAIGRGASATIIMGGDQAIHSDTVRGDKVSRDKEG